MNQIKNQIENLLQFLQPYLGLANCHMVDYFTQSCYSKFLPLEIQKEINSVGVENFTNYIFDSSCDDIPNLNNFLLDTKKFTLGYSPLYCLQLKELLENWNCPEFNTCKLEVFMSPKKSHEVEILSGIVAALSKLCSTSHIIDFGDGKGYLSSMIALHNNISVLGVDASQTNTCSANKRANKLSKVWNYIPNASRKSIPKKTETKFNENINLYKQVTEFIDESFNLEKLVFENFNSHSDLSFGLMGLHTCGNLAATSLRIFSTNTNVKTICNIGCCYHLLNEKVDDDVDGKWGFPLSQFLIDKKISIGRNARMLANQSVDRIITNKELPNITIFYRAILEVMIQDFFAIKPDKNVGKFKKIPASFMEYVRTAFKRLEADVAVTDDEIEKVFNLHKHRKTELDIFYLLRCHLAPVIENLILLDRLLFLKEQGYQNSFLVQLFNPVISPRCYAVIALKK